MSDESKTHIVFAIYDAQSRGSVMNITRRQAEYLVERGYKVTLLTNSPYAVWNGITTRLIPTCGSTMWKFIRRATEAYSNRLPRQLSRFSLNGFVDQLRFSHSATQVILDLAGEQRINGVIACQHMLAIGLKRVQRNLGIPFMIMSHGDIFEHPSNSFSIAMTWLYRKGAIEASRSADGIVTVSRRLRERAISLGAPANRVDVVYNGIDLNDIERDDSRSMSSRPEFRILAVGRLSAEKGFDVLLKSMSLLSRNGVCLQIAGAGTERMRLEGMVDVLKLTNRVQFLGEVPRTQIAETYREADVVVMPSRSDAMPLVALEAMANATPIIATRVGGLPELIEDGVSGLLVPPDDPAALALAIDRLQTEPELGRRLSTGGVKRAQDFSWPLLMERFGTIVQRHCGSPHIASMNKSLGSHIQSLPQDCE